MDDAAKHMNFGEAWEKVTVLDPFVAVLVILMALFLLFCPRKYAVWPFVVVACFVVPFQRVVVGNLDFSMMRIMTVVGLIRIVIHGELKIKWRAMDTAVALFAFTQIFIGFVGEPGAFTKNLGVAMDTFGIYLIFRCLVRNWDDVFSTVRGFCWIGIPVAGFFLFEHFTHKDLFAGQAHGYFNEDIAEREGRFRCHGAFSHPILAGCFWATMMPLMAVMWFRGNKARIEGLIGLAVCMLIIFACASSTPVASLMFACIAGGMFFFRYDLAWVRWGAVAALLAVQICWDQPIYKLLAKVDILSGSTGYYRYQLIDACVKHFDEWAVAGTATRPDKWIPGLKDVTNNYLMYGLQGGIGLIIMFLVLVWVGFIAASKIWRRAERDHLRLETYAGWALGVTLFCHCTNFLSVTYFGQIIMVWALHVAMIGSMTPSKQRRRVLKRVVVTRQPPQEAPSQAQAPFGAPVPSYRSSSQ